MRIRYWSSDLCSSDLRVLKHDLHPGAESFASPLRHVGDTLPAEADLATIAVAQTGAEPRQGDRTSVVQGKSVSVSVDLGGGGIITHTKRSELAARQPLDTAA